MQRPEAAPYSKIKMMEYYLGQFIMRLPVLLFLLVLIAQDCSFSIAVIRCDFDASLYAYSSLLCGMNFCFRT